LSLGKKSSGKREKIAGEFLNKKARNLGTGRAGFEREMELFMEEIESSKERSLQFFKNF
jgi:hypothetical protein